MLKQVTKEITQKTESILKYKLAVLMTPHYPEKALS